MSRPLTCLLIATALLASWPAAVGAAPGGVNVQGYLTTAQLVKRSGLIFTAQVLRVRPERKTVKINRRKERYVARWRVQVRPLRALLGVDDDATLRRTLDPLWLELPGDPPPGQWIVRKDVYIATWQPRLARVGQRVLVYLSGLDAVRGEGKRRSASTSYVDLAGMAVRVRKLVPQARDSQREAWRKGARCQGKTWRFANSCRDLKTIFAALGCPPLTTARQQLVQGRPLMWCESSEGTLNGLSMSWHHSGELEQRGLMVMGKRDGQWLTFWPSGKPRRVVHFNEGKAHGPWQQFHASGHKDLFGHMTHGMADGTWQAFNDAGFALGSYKMAGGTGFVTRWFPDGVKRSEVEHKKGIPDGVARSWHANATLQSQGRRSQGLEVGQWRWLHPDGTVKETRCYRQGTVIWRVEGDKVGKRRCKE